MATSTDGLQWQPVETGPRLGVQPRDVAYGAGVFAAVGHSGDIFTSPDGIGWTQRPPNGLAPLTAIASANGRFVAADAESRLPRPGTVLELQRAPTPIQSWPRLTLLSEVGRRHAVEASADLADWTLLTHTSGLLPKSTVTDPLGGDSRVRFYRARELPPQPLPPTR